MSIKNIRNLTKEITKEEWKKRIVQVGAVSMGLLLTLGCIPASKVYDNYKEKQLKIEQQKIEEEHSIKNISLLECKVVVENCSDGTVKHHFINKDYEPSNWEKYEKYNEKNYTYSGITDKDFSVSYSEFHYNTTSYFHYEEIPETYGRYIFDYNVPYYMFDATDLSLPEGYSLGELYSINDLKDLEEKLNNSIYENKNGFQRYIWQFVLAEIVDDDKFVCFDLDGVFYEITETTDIEDVTKLHYVYYIPSVESNLMNLKISSGMNAIEDKVEGINNLNIKDPGNWVIDDVTCLDKNARDSLRGKRLITRNIYDYLTPEQISNGTITYDEVYELLDKLNNKDMKRARLIEE